MYGPQSWEAMSEITPTSWRRTEVRCYAGYKADERPTSLLVDDREVQVRTMLASWREPDYLYFKLETDDGRVHELRHHEHEDYWEVRGSRQGRSDPPREGSRSKDV